MRIAYVAHVGSRSNGVLAKVRNQTTIWNELGHDARLFCVSDAAPPGDPDYLLWRRWDRLNPRRSLLRDLAAFQPDMVYWRSGNITLHTLLMLLRFSAQIVMEINSNHVEEGRHHARKALLKRLAWAFTVFGTPHVANNIAGLVCVTQELAALPDFAGQRNRLAIPNSILLRADMLCKRPSSGGPIRLLFMGSPEQDWHGVDILPVIARTLGHDFHIHVIGPRAEQLITRDLPTNITLHGYLSKEDYRPLLADMHIGIGSMAFYRNKMQEACPLKVREYIAAGLPVILPYTDTAFVDSRPDWVLELPNEEGVFVNATVLDTVRAFCEKHRDTVVRHEESAAYIDAAVLETKKLEEIKRWVRPFRPQFSERQPSELR